MTAPAVTLPSPMPVRAPATYLSTVDISPSRRHDWLREVIGREYADVEIEPPADSELFNEMCITPWRDLQLSAIRSNALALERLSREPRRIAQDAYFAVILLDGEYRLRQDGREAFLRPGDLSLYDAARPHRIDCPRPFRKLIVSIPRALLSERLAGVEHCTARRIAGDAGIGAIAANFIRHCTAEAETLASNDAIALSGHALDLLARAIATTRPGTCSLSRARQSSLAATKAIVERRFCDPLLDAGAIATSAGLSTRYINELFAAEGTSLMRHVWERRLQKSMDRLLSGEPCSLAELAWRCGFADPAHFSRAFKCRFGAPPREFRKSR